MAPPPLLDRADAIGRHYAAHGWALAQAQPSTLGPAELDAGPTFAGYPCSPTVDANGLPTGIIVDDRQAQRREKQGDVWYSVKLIDGTYARVLRIPKGRAGAARAWVIGPSDRRRAFVRRRQLGSRQDLPGAANCTCDAWLVIHPGHCDQSLS